MDQTAFFLQPKLPVQKQYEALRGFYVERLSSDEAAKRFNFSTKYFKKLRFEFNQSLKKDENPFFLRKKTGPKKSFTDREVIEKAVILRKQNHSILDIRAILEADGVKISLDTIDDILKAEGFAPLPKRTRQERLEVKIPSKIEAPQSVSLELEDEEEFSTEKGVGPLLFLPLIENLGIIQAIQAAHFPKTSVLRDVSMVLSFLALKILGDRASFSRYHLEHG
ncbi:MAG: hypothetical protein ACMUJM_18785 [bacterium]